MNPEFKVGDEVDAESLAKLPAYHWIVTKNTPIENGGIRIERIGFTGKALENERLDIMAGLKIGTLPPGKVTRSDEGAIWIGWSPADAIIQIDAAVEPVAQKS